MAAGIRVEVDWDRDGDYDETYEDITDDVMRATWRLGMREPYALVADDNTAELTVRNTNSRYTPENTSSDLYGLLQPHTRFRILDDASGTVMWTGWLEWPTIQWQPAGDYTGRHVATLLGYGGKTLLSRTDVSLPFYEDVTGGVIVEETLYQARLPTGTGTWRLGTAGKSELGDTTIIGSSDDFASLETGRTTIPVYGDRGEDDAWEIIRDVTTGEQGRFFVDRDGLMTWWNRHHMLRITDNAGTISSQVGDHRPHRVEYGYGQSISNIIRIESNPRQTGASETLWELDTTVEIPANQVRQFEARLRKANGQFAASGSLSATPSFSAGTADVGVTRQGGLALITLINDNDTLAVLSGLTLEGQPTISQNKLVVEAINEDSVDQNGPQMERLDIGPVNDYDNAASIARFELNRRSTARGIVSQAEWVRKWDGVDNAHMINWTIGTRVNVQVDELYHDADYIIMGEEHEWEPGARHMARYMFEPASSNTYWLVGTVNASELGTTTRLGY